MSRAAFLLLFLLTSTSLIAADNDWNPTKALTNKGKPFDDLTINKRAYEIFEHDVKPQWGYKNPQQDIFVVVHPKTEGKNLPLYVVLHSAGHDVISCVKCTSTVGNHDIYRAPEDFYALYVDCRRNGGDWWWGGMHSKDANLTKKNSGPEPTPVELRVMDTVRWVIKKYDIDSNRVYLAGNSMGGSGTLGIGMRHGDVFAAIKANVPAGIEHASNRMFFPPLSIPEKVKLPDPPITINYSGQNDSWSVGHERFANAMNERKYPLYFYWGPFGHANNHSAIEKVNDLINSFDWLNVKKNEAYPVFTNSSTNNKMPWPDLKSENPQTSGNINAFYRWKNISDTNEKLELNLFLVSTKDLKTKFTIPDESQADVSVRRIQNAKFKPGESFRFSFGTTKGEGKADADGLITIPSLKITATPSTLSISK